MEAFSAGYVVLIKDRFTPGQWNETPSGVFGAISQAVGMIDQYEDQQQHADRKDTYAIARLNVIMTSGPKPPAA